MVKEIRGVRKLTIATAFLSRNGLLLLNEVIKNNGLKPQNVTVYLSDDFSDTNPARLLSELMEISQVYIVCRMRLHAKVFLFEGANNFLLTGSSNLTNGGFGNNLEFNTYSNTPDLPRLEEFFNFCKELSVPATEETVEIYRLAEEERLKTRESQMEVKRITAYHLMQDSFTESDFDISDFFFNFRDYETLFKKNQKRKDIDIQHRRTSIRRKLLEINAIIEKDIVRLGLAHHWRSENITSSIIPMDFNQYQITWCGVRYTRKKTAEYVRDLKMSGEGLGFPKYACLQYCLTAEGFEINLFHAVRHGAVDRDYLHKKLNDRAYCALITSELRKLAGYKFNWIIGDDEFSLNDKIPEDFIGWYRANDSDGAESFLSFYTAPNAIEIKTKEGIAKLSVKYIKILLPLFKLLSYNWGE